MTTLRWIASPAATALYAADCLRRRLPFADAQLANALRDTAARLVRAIANTSLPVERVWAHLVPLSLATDSSRHLVELALGKLAGRHQITSYIDPIADRVAALERAFKAAAPDVADELPLRIGPLSEMWEAQGPGLLVAIGNLTDAELLPDRVTVGVLQPVTGGGGRSYPDGNVVLLEGVLANPHTRLPEVVRLAWLVAQLNLELARFQGDLKRERAIELGGWALLPATLAAAQELELAACDEATLREAVTAWRVEVPPNRAFLHDLMRWWETYCTDQPTWPIAVTALDMLIATEEE
jgi:hypothetical protein